MGIVLDTDGKQVAQTIKKYPKKDYRDVESRQTETEQVCSKRGLRLKVIHRQYFFAGSVNLCV